MSSLLIIYHDVRQWLIPIVWSAASVSYLPNYEGRWPEIPAHIEFGNAVSFELCDMVGRFETIDYYLGT